MIITIHQPQYLPYIGFFHKLMLSDVCVILDDVEYSKNDFFNRNRIKTPQGWCWITVPVKAKMKQLIKDVEIDNSQNWGVKHWKAILANYEKAAFFNEYQEFFKDYYSESWETLVDLNLKSIEYIAKKLNLNVKFRRNDGKTEFIHMLNGTAVVTSRVPIAILENFQEADGSIKIPEVLQKWMGKDKITAPGL